MKRKLCSMIGIVHVFFFSFVLLQGCSDSPCKTDRDCPSKQICSATGACQPGCVTNQDCASGKQCSVQGRCIDTAEEGSTTVVSDAKTTEDPPEKEPSTCKEGQTVPCFDGKPGLEVVGVCKSGQKACVGGVWGACIGQVLPSKEICDDKDNDCNGQVDENLTNCGCKKDEDCPAAKPNCQAGQCIRFCQKNDDCGSTDFCKDGYCQACVDGSDRSKKEECNGKDDNCNGLVDEEIAPRACGSDVGQCTKGTQACKSGVWEECQGNTKAKPEECNNLDDNCNGQIDENVTQACGSDVGECKKGTQACKAGVWETCAGETKPTTETCNGKDDNCDGQIDENLTQTCGNDVGACKKGTQTCSAGTWGTCVGETKPATEECNGKDDNCDGQVDEGLTKVCGSSDVGACKKGKSTCEKGSWGPCVGSVEPRRETCDKTDDDCDGKVDEDVAGCGCTKDIDCPAGKPKCQAGVCIKFCTKNEDCLSDEFCQQGFCQICDASSGQKEVCDGKDNDCDGQTDEGLMRDCGSDTGECKKGQQFCTQGSWSICAGEVKATTEVCDGKDNDCDGQTDEGLSSCFLPTQIKLSKTLLGHAGTVYSLALSNDGKTLFSGSYDRTIKQWDLVTGKLVRTFSGHNYTIYSLLITPDGKTLISGTYGSIKLWNIQTGANTATLSIGSRMVVLSKDGKQLFAGRSASGDIEIWDISTQKKLRTLQGHTDSIYKLAVSPDGKTLASGDYYSTIKLWDIQTGKVLHTLTGHKGAIRGMDFRADGKVLATGGGYQDSTIKLWDVQTGKNTHTTAGHTSSTYVVKFAPNGKHILSTIPFNSTVRIWDPATAKQIRSIQAGASRSPYTALWGKNGTSIIFAGSGDYGIQIWK